MENILKKYKNIIENVFFINALFLIESKHLMPDIHKYFNVVWDTVKAKTGVNEKTDFVEDERTYDIIIDETAFTGINTFFKKAKINIKLNITNDTQDYYYKGGYNANNRVLISNGKKNALLSDDKKLFVLNINANVVCYVGHLQKIIASLIFHEFCHAYEDWQRIRKSNGNNSLNFYIKSSNYKNFDFIKQWNYPYGECLYVVLYMLSQIENRAYISGTIGEMETMMVRGENRFDELIKNTVLYKNFSKANNCLNYLELIDDDVEIGLLELFNKFAGLKSPRDKDENNNQEIRYKFKSYKGLYNWLKKKTDYLYDQAIDTLSKYFEGKIIKDSYVI